MALNDGSKRLMKYEFIYKLFVLISLYNFLHLALLVEHQEGWASGRGKNLILEQESPNVLLQRSVWHWS